MRAPVRMVHLISRLAAHRIDLIGSVHSPAEDNGPTLLWYCEIHTLLLRLGSQRRIGCRPILLTRRRLLAYFAGTIRTLFEVRVSR